jgi:hypothetical protein
VPLLCNFDLGNSMREVQENEVLELNGTHELMVSPSKMW